MLISHPRGVCLFTASLFYLSIQCSSFQSSVQRKVWAVGEPVPSICLYFRKVHQQRFLKSGSYIQHKPHYSLIFLKKKKLKIDCFHVEGLDNVFVYLW